MKLWWRDDDAAADDPRLGRLLDIAAARSAPIVLAVIPRLLDKATTARIGGCPIATVVQHGLAHADHRSKKGRKCELVDRIDQDDALVAARDVLAQTFGSRFHPVMVPPWNRIEPGLRARLPALGYSALSTFAGSTEVETVPGLRIVDTHVDAIAWQDGKRPLCAQAIVEAIQAKAAGSAGPIGLLTHHAVTDDDGFQALDRAIGLLQDRFGAEFISANELF